MHIFVQVLVVGDTTTPLTLFHLSWRDVPRGSWKSHPPTNQRIECCDNSTQARSTASTREARPDIGFLLYFWPTSGIALGDSATSASTLRCVDTGHCHGEGGSGTLAVRLAGILYDCRGSRGRCARRLLFEPATQGNGPCRSSRGLCCTSEHPPSQRISLSAVREERWHNESCNAHEC